MRMAELSQQSGVPIATIKYYLREGLLPQGLPVTATRSEYGDAHLRRLGLIRALVEVGEVPVAGIGAILSDVDDRSVPPHVMLGTVQYALSQQPAAVPQQDQDREVAEAEVAGLIQDMGWEITPDAPARDLLAAALAALRRTESAPAGPPLLVYAKTMAELAGAEVASVVQENRSELAESAIVGMVLYERVLVAIHRLAQEDASAQVFASADDVEYIELRRECGMRARDVSAGAPCWMDLSTSDPAAARDFYTGLFGWTAAEASEEFGGYFMFSHNGSPVAGCMPAMAGAPTELWSVYLCVADAAKTIETAPASGGQIAMSAMPIADLGTMGVAIDPGGAAIGLWQPDQFPGITGVGDPGLPSWFELHSADYAGALAFYRDVFGWAVQTMSDTPEFKYSVLVHDGTELAGVMDASSWPAARLGWTFYVWVQDADVAAARVIELGGSVLDQPADTPYGRMATVADPGGAVFRLQAANDQMPG